MRIYKSTIIELYYYFLLSLILGIYLILPLKLDTLRNYLTISKIFLISHEFSRNRECIKLLVLSHEFSPDGEL